MKLINLPEEDAPNEFYIFQRGGALTAHQFEIGVLTSAAFSTLAMGDQRYFQKYMTGMIDYMPFTLKRGEELDVPTVSPWMHKFLNNIRLEADCEHARTRLNPRYPSRLSAIYAFGSEQDCLRAANERNWNIHSVKKFTIQSPPETTRIAKANMLIFDLASKAYSRGSFPTQDSLAMWNCYWRCGDCTVELPGSRTLARRERRERLNSGIMAEYLIEGSVRIVE